MSPLATSHRPIASLCNQFNNAFVLLISMPHFQSINFYENRPKIKLFLQKYPKFSSAGAPPKIYKTAPPPLQTFGYAPNTRCVLLSSYFQVLEPYNEKLLS